MRVPRTGVNGVECPGCGSIRTKTLDTGYTDFGLRLRRRKCIDCDEQSFSTVEVMVPLPFTALDTNRALKKVLFERRKNGHQPRKGYSSPPKTEIDVRIYIQDGVDENRHPRLRRIV